MSEVWWGKESRAVSAGKKTFPPELVPASRQVVRSELVRRIKDFTPEWTNLRPDDAGVALTQLFSEQMEPVLERLNRLPEKTFVEFLNAAGTQRLQASPAAALLEFEVSDSSPQSVFVNKGFQVSAPAADGSSDIVIFETVRDLNAAPAKIAELHVRIDNVFEKITVAQGETFLPFGTQPEPGRALFIGIASNVTPGPTLAIGIRIAAPPGAPPPISNGGVAPLPIAPGPRLEWSALNGTRFVPLEILIDETGGLIHSGSIELQVPRDWKPGRPSGMAGTDQLRWLRLEIASGAFEETPVLSSVKLNIVQALAARSIFNEALEPVPNSRNRQMSLTQKPVLPESLIIEVEEGGFAPEEPELDLPVVRDDSDQTPNELRSKVRRWVQVSSLVSAGPEDEVYTLDPLSGIVTFGDGVHGAEVPQGFRNVRAARYQAGGGQAGAVAAEAISTLLSSVAFITKVTNPWPATGGHDAEKRSQTLKRGPQEIRARGRAVTTADYALLAREAKGALIERAHAVSGLHPNFPGRPIPGVVGVFVVPPDRNEGPPTPDEDTLRAVATHLSKFAAPAGVEVVASATKFHRIKIEAAITVRAGADEGKAVRDAVKALSDYLHPLKGGSDGAGWPFGGTLHYQSLVRRLTNINDITSVPTLNIIADGSRFLRCTDFVPDANALFWPEIHQVVVQARKEAA